MYLEQPLIFCARCCYHNIVHSSTQVQQYTQNKNRLPYGRLFTQVATFTDVFNILRAGYFHYCIIRDIKPHEQNQTIFAIFMCGQLMKVPVRK